MEMTSLINPRPLYHVLANKIVAMANCREMGNEEWLSRHRDEAEQLVRDMMPSGSGIDSGTTLDFDASKPDKLVFDTSFHHMNDGGMYDGWTEHTVIVTPSLSSGFDVRITGRNRNEIKDYLADIYHEALRQNVEA
jgi:hypothetical protein